VGIARVDYVILYVNDLDASIAFYRDVIGLPFKFERNRYAEFGTENCKFGLYARDEAENLLGRRPTEGGPAGAVLFLVDDVDAEETRLRRLQMPILAGATDRPWGHRTLHIADPDGFVVELAQEIPRES
jgi:lactoylglutathione lyase